MTLNEYCAENEEKKQLSLFSEEALLANTVRLDASLQIQMQSNIRTCERKSKKKYFYFLKMCWCSPVIDEAQVAAHQQLRYLRWYMRQHNTIQTSQELRKLL